MLVSLASAISVPDYKMSYFRQKYMYNNVAIIHSYPLCISLTVYSIRFSAGLFSYMFFDGSTIANT